MPDDRAPLEVETALYRITQEALHNVVKHAEANAVTITLAGSADDGLRLTVQDDGTGFDPSVVPAGHLGIAGMRARASQIGATIDVVSAPGSARASRCWRAAIGGLLVPGASGRLGRAAAAGPARSDSAARTSDA